MQSESALTPNTLWIWNLPQLVIFSIQIKQDQIPDTSTSFPWRSFHQTKCHPIHRILDDKKFRFDSFKAKKWHLFIWGWLFTPVGRSVSLDAQEITRDLSATLWQWRNRRHQLRRRQDSSLGPLKRRGWVDSWWEFTEENEVKFGVSYGMTF